MTYDLDSNKLVLERLYKLLENRNTFDPNFLIGIAQGEIFEYPYSRLISLPGAPEKWSNNNNEFEWEIRIHPNNYLARQYYKFFNEDFNNDFDEIKDEINNLNSLPNKIIAHVTVKPNVTDETFLSVLGEIIRSRGMRSGYFKSDFIDGLSGGTWQIRQIEVAKMPNMPQFGMHSNNKISTATKNVLFIQLPFENYEHKINDNFDNDEKYILKVANEIKHFKDEIYKVEVKSL